MPHNHGQEELALRRRSARSESCHTKNQPLHDPFTNRPEDVLKVDADEEGVGGDDCADAVRYLVATKARTVLERKLRGL